MELTMTNKTIAPTKCVKFLGGLIDEKLKWDEHIKTVKQKNKQIFLCHKPRKTLSKKSRHIILLFGLPIFNIWNHTLGSNL